MQPHTNPFKSSCDSNAVGEKVNTPPMLTSSAEINELSTDKADKPSTQANTEISPKKEAVEAPLKNHFTAGKEEDSSSKIENVGDTSPNDLAVDMESLSIESVQELPYNANQVLDITTLNEFEGFFRSHMSLMGVRKALVLTGSTDYSPNFYMKGYFPGHHVRNMILWGVFVDLRESECDFYPCHKFLILGRRILSFFIMGSYATPKERLRRIIYSICLGASGGTVIAQKDSLYPSRYLFEVKLCLLKLDRIVASHLALVATNLKILRLNSVLVDDDTLGSLLQCCISLQLLTIIGTHNLTGKCLEKLHVLYLQGLHVQLNSTWVFDLAEFANNHPQACVMTYEGVNSSPIRLYPKSKNGEMCAQPVVEGGIKKSVEEKKEKDEPIVDEIFEKSVEEKKEKDESIVEEIFEKIVEEKKEKDEPIVEEIFEKSVEEKKEKDEPIVEEIFEKSVEEKKEKDEPIVEEGKDDIESNVDNSHNEVSTT